MFRPGTVVERLRLPEYTGENRCVACTVLNVALAAIGCAHVGVWFAVADYPAAGAVVVTALFGLSLATIWLRGYLVPRTPRLTATYLPRPILRLFGKTRPTRPVGVHGPSGPAVDADAEVVGGARTESAPAETVADAVEGAETTAVDVAAVLERAGAIERGPSGDRRLAAEVRTAWRDAIDDVSATDDASLLLDRFGIGGESVELADRGRARVARVGGERVGTWESDAAFAADLAAAVPLADRVGGWSSLTPVRRGRLCKGLRAVLETCPACGGPLALGSERVESCCGSRAVAARACEDCGARLFEFPVEAGDSERSDGDADAGSALDRWDLVG